MRDQNAIETMMTIVEEVLEDNEGEVGISDLSVVRDVLAWVLDPKVSDDNVNGYIPGMPTREIAQRAESYSSISPI